jgi:undecaprenyl-diphosphatase
VDDYLRAVVLGLVQAFTEFLPISSSGHLVLAPQVLGDEVSSLTFDVGLHVGTLAAVIVYFWHEWMEIIGYGARDIVTSGLRIRRWDWRSRLGLWIVLGTVPAVIVGALFDQAIEDNLRQAWLVGVLLIAFGLLLGAADRMPEKRWRLQDVTAGASTIIGIAQAIALVPGVSRSGATITAARGLSFDRAAAARFSFLLSAPAVLGAATLKFGEALTGNEDVRLGPMLVGAAVSAVAGAAVIHWLLRFLQTHTMWPFVWYRIGLGVLVLLIAGVRTV